MNVEINGSPILTTLPIFGGIPLTATLVVTWSIMLLLTLFCIWLTHDLRVDHVTTPADRRRVSGQYRPELCR